MNTRNVIIAIVVAIIIVASGVTAFELHNNNGSSKVTLTETGSSLLYPVFNLWAKNYTNATISTASTGSGTGISSAIAGTVDIGASDAMIAALTSSAPSAVLNIPILISYQYIAYNVPTLNNYTLKFNANVIAGIYDGTITKWNDPAILALNPTVPASDFPDKTIIPVHRSDGSGDTFMFTSFLSKGNATWDRNIGSGVSVTWASVAAATTGVGNPGIISAMNSTPYTIGYIAATYEQQVHSDHFGVAQLLNKAGNYVNATVANVTTAVSQYLSQIPANGTIAVQFAPGNTSYPIADMEYVIINESQSSIAKATALKDFLSWVVSPSGGSQSKYLDQLNLAPLPSNVVSKIVQPLINQIHGPGGTSSNLITLSETGSSLLYPVFNTWAANYTGATVITASTGSGTGISSAIAGTVQIGASDAMISALTSSAPSTVMNIPILISYQYIAYNVPTLNSYTLRLNAGVIAGIFDGTITKWNDPAIEALNPSVPASAFPNHTIIPVHRSDGSGDTFMFTSFLSKGNATWNNTVGSGVSVTWPSVAAATTGIGNPGIISAMASAQYTIGYIAATYQAQVNADHFGVATLENRDGNFVNATVANVTTAVSQYLSQIPANGTIAVQYAPGASSYPIADMEYVIVQKTQSSAAEASALQAFLNWVVNPNDGSQSSYLAPLNLVALPSNVVNNVTKPLINQITG